MTKQRLEGAIKKKTRSRMRKVSITGDGWRAHVHERLRVFARALTWICLELFAQFQGRACARVKFPVGHRVGWHFFIDSTSISIRGCVPLSVRPPVPCLPKIVGFRKYMTTGPASRISWPVMYALSLCLFSRSSYWTLSVSNEKTKKTNNSTALRLRLHNN